MKSRMLCGVVGAMACLIAGLILEACFHIAHVPTRLAQRGAGVLIFPQSEIARRLEQAGAHGGDVEISLSWNDTNDLDLSCTEPTGFHIYYAAKKSRLGGTLDIDRNSVEPYITNPVEHIYWPRGKAPLGKYQIYVSYYARHHGPERSPYNVHIVARGRVQDFSGVAVHDGTPGPLVLVTTLEVGEPGFFERWLDPMLLVSILVAGCWGAALTALLAFALYEAQRQILAQAKRSDSAVSSRQPAIWYVWNGALVGFTAAAIGQAVFSSAPSDTSADALHLLRIIGLALTGGFIGAGLSRFVPNLQRAAAAIAGTVGGWVGGVLLLLSFESGDSAAARLYVAGLMGFAIGFMISLVFDTVMDEIVPGLQMSLKPLRRGAYRSSNREP